MDNELIEKIAEIIHSGGDYRGILDRDKAIELEIEFAGEELSPAFKVLSESQINSFGFFTYT